MFVACMNLSVTLATEIMRLRTSYFSRNVLQTEQPVQHSSEFGGKTHFPNKLPGISLTLIQTSLYEVVRTSSSNHY